MLTNKINRFIYIISVSFTNSTEDSSAFVLYDSRKKPDDVILLETSVFYPYVTPKQIVDTVPFIDVFELDKIVKQYMYYYGIETIRGGSYQSEVLIPEQILFLQKEFDTITNCSNQTIDTNENHRSNLYDKITNYYKENKIEDMNKELHRIDYEWQHYKDAKQKYEKIKHYSVDGEPATFGIHSMENLQWLIDFIIYGEATDILPNETKTSYKRLIKIIKQLTTTFFSIKDGDGDGDSDSKDSVNFEPKILFDKPEFLLDAFFYHRKSMKNWENEIDAALKFIHQLEYMTFIILNRLSELEYDLSTHPENANEYYDMSKKWVLASIVTSPVEHH